MSTRLPHVCMLAAENDVLPGAKVGGIGDVVRDIPAALANLGAHVSVIIPAYGTLHKLPGATHEHTLSIWFADQMQRVDLFEVFHDRDPGVRYLVLQNDQFAACGAGSVYCDDDANNPFATDATKFALFCLASATAIRDGLIGEIDVLHCHDWHTGFTLMLREYARDFEALRSIRTVFSIHNLALQGVRPFTGHDSSLAGWFPGVNIDRAAMADPRWPNCVNPMAAGIRLADRVHTVSPTYATEIVQANDPARGFHGGEGLEHDLQQAAASGRLTGIINGIDYPTTAASPTPEGASARGTRKTAVKAGRKNPDNRTRSTWQHTLSVCSEGLLGWTTRHDSVRSVDFLAAQRLTQWQSAARPRHVITSVGRLTAQKMALLLTRVDNGQFALEAMLDKLKVENQVKGVVVLLGSGDRALEMVCRQIASRYSNLLFLNGYSTAVSDALFADGDLFLMPSSFEPCGISQMLAMRQEQPCLVHAVGGLVDTVNDNIDGFHFQGNSLYEQAHNLVARFDDIISLRERAPTDFRQIAQQAGQQRFAWKTSAERYMTELYA